MIFRKPLIALGLLFGVLSMSPLASANIVTNITATGNCTSYTLNVTADDLVIGNTYSIVYSGTVTCGGVTQMVSGTSASFNATAVTENLTVPGGLSTGTTAGFVGDCTFSITAYVDTDMQDEGTFTGSFPVNCPGVNAACMLPPSGTAIGGAPVSWNGFNAPTGSVVWINAHITSPKNVPTNTITTVDFTGVSLVVNATTYALPDGHVVFNPGTTTPSTVVNLDGSWTTTVNPSFSNDIFFDGQAIPVDANLENGGHGNTGSTLSFSTSSNDAALQFQWQWSAAVYTSWPGNAAANIEPVHGQLQAGAPLNTAVEKDLIQGPRGGGGSNFTGSWSGTGKGNCEQSQE